VMVSTFEGFEFSISFLWFRVSRFLGIKVSRHQSLNIFEILGIKVS
jgi:hypothetical protein